MVPTEGGSNLAVLARKEAPLFLSKIDVTTVSSSLDTPEAAFLPAIGNRIRRELQGYLPGSGRRNHLRAP